MHAQVQDIVVTELSIEQLARILLANQYQIMMLGREEKECSGQE